MRPAVTSSSSGPSPLVWLTILMIGGAYAWLSLNMPLTGDDLTFANFFDELDATWKGIPVVMKTFRDQYHPRTADMLLTVIWGDAPTWLMAAINGVGTAAMFAAVMLAATRRSSHTLARMLVIALTAFTLRWDSIWMEMCTQSNCVWSAAAGIAAILLVSMPHPRREHDWHWFLLPLLLLAGALHEGLAISILCGCSAWIVTGDFWRRASASRKGMLIALLAGCLLPFSAASLYRRMALNSLYSDNQPFWQIILESGYYVVILAIAVVWLAFRHKRLLRHLVRSQWIIFAVGAAAGLVVMLAAGYGGRPGWFAQIFALIALARIARHFGVDWNRRVQSGLSLAIFLLLGFHFFTLGHWQSRLADETREVIAAYQASPNGIVLADYTPDADLPWWLFHKAHGVPDADDVYYRLQMQRYYSPAHSLVVLPSAAAGVKMDSLSAPTRIGRYILSPSPLPQRSILRPDSPFPSQLVEVDGLKFVEQPVELPSGSSIFVYEILDEDYGNR